MIDEGFEAANIANVDREILEELYTKNRYSIWRISRETNLRAHRIRELIVEYKLTRTGEIRGDPELKGKREPQGKYIPPPGFVEPEKSYISKPKVRKPRKKSGIVVQKNGYVVFNGQAYHRYVWEQANGPIPKGWIIHHINGIPGDNRLENLLAVPKGKHSTSFIVEETMRRLNLLDEKNVSLKENISAYEKYVGELLNLLKDSTPYG